ncbi:DUF6765 family protein [Halanaerobium congolense]|jgi:hypothetical protein|uniref:DUF6765 family protein n=1 Tax=Halanaerobium congolense TaxID=54121 RepID=UPI0007996337|nr:DUF6765 family protein [Halanaerobium congolense]KXS47873.1 MAG: putative signal peptide-contaiing protein [Halanaerobium sp. T82-1]OEG61735.1 MAG: hypothetical protein BHK79_01900 [Halanaerobium sp. MDAL1]SHN02334.1 hypothetical protein SAMN04515650_11719 [Halanaerobium congolense]
MKKDAHYYALLAMSRSVGIEKETAHKIAYASQFVDDAKVNKITLAADNPSDLLSELGDEILNAATCHSYSDLSTYNYSSMTANTSAFHFVPGCEGRNFPKKMRCKKESKIIKFIVEEAVNNADPIKLGITLHAYADTFSHQGFSGIASKVNDVEGVRENNQIYISNFQLLKEKRWKEIGTRITTFLSELIKDRVVPAYGHGQVYSYPDIPYLDWRYEYDATDNFSSQYQVSRVKNKERFIEALKKIKDILQKFLENNNQYRDDSIVEVDYEEFNSILTARKVEEERIADWKDFMLTKGLLSSSDQNIIEYDHNIWLKEAFKDFINCDFERRIVNDVHLADDFLQSNWYKYYQGIQWYKQLFFKAAEKNGLSIPNNYS